jgi:rubrerythrin
MSDKPSYLGLLNAVSLAESAAHEYLECWIAVTPNDDVRCVLQAVSAREGEHGKAFAKRINELGYNLKPKDDPNQAKRLRIAQSDRTDLQKMEKFGLDRLDTGDKPDVFDSFFNDHTIDVKTGELLGRYIAEERDSGRLLRACYEQLKDTAGRGTSGVADDRLASLEAKVDAVCAAVEGLRDIVSAPAKSANGKARTRATASKS